MKFEVPAPKQETKELMGVERIWETGRGEIMQEATLFSHPDSLEKASKLLNDEKFKKHATQEWEKILSKTKTPNETELTESRLIRGLRFRLIEEIKKGK